MLQAVHCSVRLQFPGRSLLQHHCSTTETAGRYFRLDQDRAAATMASERRQSSNQHCSAVYCSRPQPTSLNSPRRCRCRCRCRGVGGREANSLCSHYVLWPWKVQFFPLQPTSQSDYLYSLASDSDYLYQFSFYTEQCLHLFL